MAIIYYTNRPQRAVAPAIDQLMAKPKVLTSTGNHDLAATLLTSTLSYPAGWKVTSIALQFSTAQSKTYTASKQNGRKVVEEENDYLWFITDSSYPTKITLDEGFYTGTELAVELKDKLDTAFSPLTFTVDYSSTTANKYTIVPSSGTIKYLDINYQANFVFKQSIAGHLFGFLADSAFAASLGSDTEVPALDLKVPLFTATNTNLTVLDSDEHTFSIDQGLVLDITKTGGACLVDWAIDYEEIV